MKVTQFPRCLALALFCTAPTATAAAAKCRMPAPSSSAASSAASASPSVSLPVAPPSPPDCNRNYISNGQFTSPFYWSFGGDSTTGTSCGLYSTCAHMNADAGPASISQTFEVVPGYTYNINVPYMYVIEPATSEIASCVVSSGTATMSFSMPYRSLNQYWGSGGNFVPEATMATLTCTLTSTNPGTVYISAVSARWNNYACAG
ncbi:MAG: hypothetical protein STHCBS139747_007349 [Sporothrix thermara]